MQKETHKEDQLSIDTMVRNVVKLSSSTLVHSVARSMNKNNLGCLIAEENGEARGIVALKELKSLEKTKDHRKLDISDIMTKKLIVGSPDMEIRKAR